MKTTEWLDRRLDRRTMKEMERFLKGQARRARESVRSVMTQRWSAEAGRSPDSATWATETLHDEIQVELVDRLGRQVAQIDAALGRLARREYGVCHDCGEFIGLARLRALPFAQRCRPCQTRAEEVQDNRATKPVSAFIAAANDY